MESLRKIRKSRNITQKDIAKYLNISQNTYSYWETGKVKIDNEALVKLAKYFDIPLNELMGIEPSRSDRLTKLFEDVDLLNDDGQKKVKEYIKDLAGNPKYRKNFID